MKKIVFVNAHWNNRGDEAALRAIIDGILEKRNDVKILIIFKDKGEIQQFPYHGIIDYITTRFLPTDSDVKRAIDSDGKEVNSDGERDTINALRDADLVVYSPGGAVISDRFWWTKQLEYLFPIAYANSKKIPVVFAAPSIGPFNEKQSFRTDVLHQVKKICVREKLSLQTLIDDGVCDNAVTTIDSAFLNTIDKKENEEALKQYAELKDFLGKYDRVVGITITDFAWHVEHRNSKGLQKRIKESFKEFIKYLKEKNIGVLLIPQLFGNQNDIDYLYAFTDDNTMVLSNEKDTFFQQYVILKLYAVVGMRYHSNIFAAKMGIPFIPIVYEEKMQGFIEFAEWEPLEVGLSELSQTVLQEKFEYLTENYIELFDKLKSRNMEWKGKAQQTVDSVLEVLKG